jgi:zinc transport system substrate-binding protein
MLIKLEFHWKNRKSKREENDRMKKKVFFVVILLAVLLVVGVGFTALISNRQRNEESSEELLVVTSFYPMYVAAKNIIGDCEGIRLENLSEPQTGCLHDYQLTTEDMKLLSTADVFIVNGGGIESFLTDVVEQYPDLIVVNACENLTLEDDNAHAWMNMEDYMVQVETICDGLSAADALHEDAYRENEAVYTGKIQDLIAEAQELKESIQGESVVLFHEAYEYVADEYGLNVAGIMDLDEERQISAGEVADVLSAIEEHQVSVILAEELYGQDMGNMMEEETDVSVIYLDTLTRGTYDADSYINGMKQNIALLREAFQ